MAVAEEPSDDEDETTKPLTQRVNTPVGSDDETGSRFVGRNNAGSDSSSEEDDNQEEEDKLATKTSMQLEVDQESDDDDVDMQDETGGEAQSSAPTPTSKHVLNTQDEADNESDEDAGVTTSLASISRVSERSLALDEANSRIAGTTLGSNGDLEKEELAASGQGGDDFSSVGNGVVDKKSVEKINFVVRNHGNGNQQFYYLPKEDILHACFVDRNDKPLVPKPIPVQVYHGNQQMRNTFAEGIWQSDPSWFLSAFEIWKGLVVRAGAAAPLPGQQAVIGFIPVKYDDPEGKVADLIPGEYQLLLPLPSVLIKKLYDQPRNNLPTSYRPIDKVCKYLALNAEKTAAVDPRYVEIEKRPPSAPKTAGSKTAGSKTAGSKASAKASKNSTVTNTTNTSATVTTTPAPVEDDADDEEDEEQDINPQKKRDHRNDVSECEVKLAKSLMNADGATKRAHKRMKISQYDMTDGKINLSLCPGFSNAHVFVVYTGGS